jgi:hypothetical protein
LTTAEGPITPVQLRLEFQENAVADEVSAMTAVVCPILQGVLYALKADVAAAAGGYLNLPLYMLARLRRPGDGDVGICFEYAVHDALNRGEPRVLERVTDALARCNLVGSAASSILFGAEKDGAINLIDTARERLTRDSSLLYGTRGRPVKLIRHIDSVAAAFRSREERDALPQSISGLWKADLFTGFTDSDKWIGTTLKVSRNRLEGARGLRLGIVPAEEGKSDAIFHDDSKNLVVCPLPYDGSFMQIFYEAWEVVVQFFKADAKLPAEAYLPRPPARQVARYLADRRTFPVLEVIDALGALAQPHLLRSQTEAGNLLETRDQHRTQTTTAVLAPVAEGT